MPVALFAFARCENDELSSHDYSSRRTNARAIRYWRPCPHVVLYSTLPSYLPSSAAEPINDINKLWAVQMIVARSRDARKSAVEWPVCSRWPQQFTSVCVCVWVRMCARLRESFKTRDLNRFIYIF